jgi:hypothetical protein
MICVLFIIGIIILYFSGKWVFEGLGGIFLTLFRKEDTGYFIGGIVVFLSTVLYTFFLCLTISESYESYIRWYHSFLLVPPLVISLLTLSIFLIIILVQGLLEKAISLLITIKNTLYSILIGSIERKIIYFRYKTKIIDTSSLKTLYLTNKYSLVDYGDLILTIAKIEPKAIVSLLIDIAFYRLNNLNIEYLEYDENDNKKERKQKRLNFEKKHKKLNETQLIACFYLIKIYKQCLNKEVRKSIEHYHGHLIYSVGGEYVPSETWVTTGIESRYFGGGVDYEVIHSSEHTRDAHYSGATEKFFFLPKKISGLDQIKIRDEDD